LALSARLPHQLRTSLEAEFFLASDAIAGVFPADPRGTLDRSLREMGYYLALIQEFGRWRLGLRYDYYNPDQDSNKNAKAVPSRRMRAIPPWRWPRPVWRPGAD